MRSRFFSVLVILIVLTGSLPRNTGAINNFDRVPPLPACKQRESDPDCAAVSKKALQDASTVMLFNDRLGVQVASNGQFNMGAFPNPATGRSTGNSWDLLYRWDVEPWTSFTTLRVDGSDYIYGYGGISVQLPVNINATTNQSQWQFGTILVTQTVQIVFNNQTGQYDAAKIFYVVQNTDTVPHDVGSRILMDTEINYNDGALYRVPGVGLVTHEREFFGSDIPDTIQEFFDVTDNVHVAASTFRTGTPLAPDRLILAQWQHLYQTAYDYTVDPSFDFTDPSIDRPDSAYAVYWNPATLRPGETRMYVTSSGLAQLTVDLRPPLAMGISAPKTLAVQNNSYSPNPFSVTATILNNGSDTATDVHVTLDPLPLGLSLASGNATQLIGDLAAGKERQVSWEVRAAPQHQETSLNYSVTATASNTQPKTVAVSITLPKLESTGQPERPLIFIPGIAGSYLYKAVADVGGGTIYLQIWPGAPALHKNLILSSTGEDSTVIAPDVIRELPRNSPLPLERIYQPLLKRLTDSVEKGGGGYREYQVHDNPDLRTTAGCDMSQASQKPNLFVFAYDWRLDNAKNAEKLADYVGCIQKFYPGIKVDILTHSMGGLLARRYILDHPDDHSVNKLITIAAPWLGAPKAIDVLETGQFGISPILISTDTIAKVARSAPGAHQLLPGPEYYQVAGSLFSEEGWDINGSCYSLLDYLNNCNYEVYKTFDALQSMLDNRYSESDPGSSAKNFHGYKNKLGQGQDDWSTGSETANPTGIEYYHIYGKQQSRATIGSVRSVIGVECNYERGGPSIPSPLPYCFSGSGYRVTMVDGDGTVPVESASRIGNGNNLNAKQNAHLIECDANNKDFDHTSLPSYEPALEQVLFILQGIRTSRTECRSRDAQTMEDHLTQAQMETSSASLANYLRTTNALTVTVADEFGNSTAPISDTLVGMVPGIEDHLLTLNSHLIVMPSDQTFTVTFHTGISPIGLELTTGTGQVTSQAIRYHDLSLPPNVIAILRITPQGVENLRYDADGDGTFETVVQPTVSVSGPDANDLEPPTIAISRTGALDKSTSTINATDSGTGVKAVYYSLDGTTYQQYTGPVEVNATQTPTLYVFADDNVANRSSLIMYPLARSVYLPLTLKAGNAPAGVPSTPEPSNPTPTAPAPTSTPTPSPTPTATPAPAPSPINRILFTSKRDGNREVYVMNEDGTNQQRLTNTAADEGWPGWSPDGKHIVFWSARAGNNEIYAMNADGTNQMRLTNNPADDEAPAWSPDGSQIAFMSTRSGNADIYVMNADGTNVRQLTTSSSEDNAPAWSPDGRSIVFRSKRDGNLEIYIMDSDGSNQRRVTNNTADDRGPAWSPDGRSIVYSSKRDGNFEIYVMNTDGTNQRRLTNNTTEDRLPSWSPDGRSIVFTATRDGNAEIYIMNTDGTNQRNLSNNAAVDDDAGWGVR